MGVLLHAAPLYFFCSGAGGGVAACRSIEVFFLVFVPRVGVLQHGAPLEFFLVPWVRVLPHLGVDPGRDRLLLRTGA